MEQEYGYDVCPLDSNKSCYDFDRLGMIACGMCGANKELAEEGQKNFFEGLARNIKEMKNK